MFPARQAAADPSHDRVVAARAAAKNVLMFERRIPSRQAAISPAARQTDSNRGPEGGYLSGQRPDGCADKSLASDPETLTLAHAFAQTLRRRGRFGGGSGCFSMAFF